MKIFLGSLLFFLFNCNTTEKKANYELFLYSVEGLRLFCIENDKYHSQFNITYRIDLQSKGEVPNDISRKLHLIFKNKKQSYYEFDRNEECIDIRIIRKTMEEADTITIARVSEHEFMESDLNQIHPNLYEVINYFDKENFIEININDQ